MLRYRNRLSKFETLESRRLLASDIAFEMASRESSPISQLTLDAVAEGEAQANLVQFAKDLTTSGTVFFGAGWCPACTVQKDLFEDGGDDLPFVEVTNPDRSLNQIGAENNIELFPTWVFPDGSRLTGVLTLSELSEAAGVPIPTGESPSFTEIGSQTVLIGSPLHIPVDAYDPNGEPLTVTVSVEDESLLEAVVIEGNRSIRIDMDGYGDMVFELFEQRAPRASGRVIELAEADFYDDVIFHRIIDDFVIQGGDPTGTGSGGSPLGDFDDDFHPDLQHNRPGILSYAKAGDDTNDSQFFITEVPTRFLDFQHSVFGVLVEGEDVREAISEHAVNATDRPTVEISINAIDVFEDSENSVFMLKPTGNGVGSTNVTVVVTDSSGNSSTETFQVDVGVDTFNTQPFLNEMDLDPLYPIGEPVSVQLSRTDVEGDPANFFAELLGNTPNVGLALSETAVLTVTPPPDFQGVLRVRTFTQEIGRGGSDFDTQILEFEFGEPIVQLAGESDSGVEGDSITNATNLTFDLFGLAENTTGELLIDGVVAETWSSSEPSFSVTTDAFASLADGSYDVSARINSGGQTVITAISVVTLDRTVPEFDLSNVPAAIALGSAASWEVLYVGDDSGPNGTEVDAVNQVAASLDNGPTGMRIANHELLWTPVPQQLGRHTYRLTATDRAGNQVTSSFSIEVTPDPNVTPLVEIALVVVDGDGMEVDQLEVGEPFQL
ncbi:MAG: peptidylprolyl isomerase, partial [Planctomycetota bacterium]